VITQYKVGPIGDGAVSGTSGTDAVTGSGSHFTRQAAAGDTIVIIDDLGGHDSYVIKTITDNTHLETVTNLSETYTASSYYILRAANLFTTPQYYPKSQYSLGDQVRLASGLILYRGYARSTWEWARMSVAELKALRTFVLNGSQSGQCYILTRDADDTWDTYRAIVDFPDPQGLTRWAEGYSPVTLTFYLVVAV
jgi:hypothetical protein